MATTWSSLAAADTISYPEVIGSRTLAEQKLPIGVVIEWRRQRDQPAPATSQARANTGIAEKEAVRIYKLEGVSVGVLIDALDELNLKPHFVSSTQPYVTAYMSTAQLMALAETPALTSAKQVVGPRAQGQTEPSISHRVNDEIIQIETGLTGSGVVVGLISLPFKVDYKTELDNESAIPASDALYILQGAGLDEDDCTDDQDAVDQVCLDHYARATTDALNLLQIIYDIAPDAQVVVASPGFDSEPEQMAEVIDLLAEGDGAVPAANIIIDDLYYPATNPFALAHIANSIQAATGGGLVYITAAGDGGADSSSDIHAGFFNAINAPTAITDLNGFLSTKSVHDFGERGYLLTQEVLERVCLFWNERPAVSGSVFFSLYVYDDAGEFVDGVANDAPGGCTTQEVPADATIFVDVGLADIDLSLNDRNFRFILSGDRAQAPVDLALTTSVFDIASSGSIRGHAAVAEAITVAGAQLCSTDAATPYADCNTIDIGPYSADGDNLNQRFFWQLEGSNFEEIVEPKIALKPNIAAAGKATVREWNGSAAEDVSHIGTSTSAAVAAGVAALYWEYRSDSVTEDVVLAREVEAALRDATIDDTGIADFDGSFGWGVLDVPKALDPDGDGVANGNGETVFDEPLPPSNVAVTGTVGGVLLSFDKSMDDINNDPFLYEVSCNDSGSFSRTLFPSDSNAGIEGDNRAPVLITALPGEPVTCTVTPRKDENSSLYARSLVSAVGAAEEVAAVAVSMTSQAAGVILEFEPSAIDGEEGVSYEVTCSENGNPIFDWEPNLDAEPETPYVFQAIPNRPLQCGVAVVVDVEGTLYLSIETSASAVSGSIPEPTVSIIGDQGGVSVSWSVANIADPSMATATLQCTNASTGDIVINNESLSYGGGFVAADAGEVLSCSVSTTVRVNGVVRASNTSSSVAVTPEEEGQSGLPIWLLYIATQPEEPIL